MSEPGVTKQILAYAVKELMKEQPLSKITVGAICDVCEMNRKSFYYHFHDKYDLVNWIFRTDFLDGELSLTDTSRTARMERMCDFLARNRQFYQSALRERGQNSFYEYLGEVFRPMVMEQLRESIGNDSNLDFFCDLFVYACRDAVVRWLDGGCEQSPKQFVHLLIRACTMSGNLASEKKNFLN